MRTPKSRAPPAPWLIAESSAAVTYSEVFTRHGRREENALTTTGFSNQARIRAPGCLYCLFANRFTPISPEPDPMNKNISIRGAREHNLKGFDVELPRDKLVVITGLSGSGKSSLAFDTIYAEGQRRYVESLSAYARQFLQLMQ